MNAFEQHLKTLSKDELITLLIQYAPQSFRDIIQNKNDAVKLKSASSIQQDQIFKDLQSKIEKLFGKEIYAQDIEAFEAKMLVYFEKMRGLWSSKIQEIVDLFCWIFEQVDEKFEDGELWGYGDEWGVELYFEGKELLEYLIEFAKEIPVKEKAKALNTLWEGLNGMGHATFFDFKIRLNEYLLPTDAKALKDFFMKEVNLGQFQNEQQVFIFNFLTPELNSFEYETFLFEFAKAGNQHFILRKVHYYEEKGNDIEAVKTINNFLKNHQEDVYLRNDLRSVFHEERIRFAKKLDEYLLPFLNNYISNIPQEDTLRIVIAEMPEEKESFEEVFKDKKAVPFMDYLEKENRLDEIAEMLSHKKYSNLSGDWTYNFFKRHKIKYPVPAMEVFENRLKKAFESVTGNGDYERITEAFRHIQPLTNKSEFKSRINSVIENSEYKRKRNLVALLKGLI